MKRLFLVLLRKTAFVVFVLGSMSHAEAQSPHGFKTYRDLAHGVRFIYPVIWKLSDGTGFYMGTTVLNTGNGPTKAIAAVGFSGGGMKGDGPYPKTNLDGIQFAYTVRATSDQVSCEQIAKDGADKDSERYETIHGVRYLHTAGADAGLGHSVESEIYAAYRGGQCYLFEQDIHTIAPGLYDGEKVLSKGIEARLRGQLRAIMQSVRIESVQSPVSDLRQ